MLNSSSQFLSLVLACFLISLSFNSFFPSLSDLTCRQSSVSPLQQLAAPLRIAPSVCLTQFSLSSNTCWQRSALSCQMMLRAARPLPYSPSLSSISHIHAFTDKVQTLLSISLCWCLFLLLESRSSGLWVLLCSAFASLNLLVNKRFCSLNRTKRRGRM